MPIKVCFRGPMLFVTDDASGAEKDDVVNRVVIPDATSVGKHGDGTQAKPHFAGLLLIESGKTRFLPLEGRKVEITADGETNLPKVDAAFLGVPPLHEMTHPAGSKAAPIQRRKTPDHAPTIVEFKGGSMSGQMVMKQKMELTRHKAPAMPWDVTSMPVWKSDAATGTIKITGGEHADETIKLGPGVEAYIYNWDAPFPTLKTLKDETTHVNSLTDEDFKWVYGLLKPDKQTWKEWLDGESDLPTPRVIPGPGFTPPLSTCNSARARGLPPA